MKKKTIVDVFEIWNVLWSSKKKFLIVWAVTFLLACLWILPKPRYYDSTVALAPETTNPMLGGGMSSLASSFGLNLGGASEDAIYPTLYPDLFESTDFIVSLFDINVVTADSLINTDYYTYMAVHQKQNWLTYPFVRAMTLTKRFLSGEKAPTVSDVKKIDPFRLSRFDTDIVKTVSQKIKCDVDKKTDVITINVTDQDPLVSATLADAVRERLQEFITEYRTHKIRIDLEHYREMADSTNLEYRSALNRYSQYCDTHQDAFLQSVASERDELENDMQLKYTTYTAMQNRLDAAKVKLQERTPAFTTLKSATVPVKPTGPKRMIFVAAMLVLATMGYSLWLVFKNRSSIISYQEI